jgi:EAL domain-containing protein (putative c-di-GMP-specific phosphodiesterase class I)
MDDLTPPSLPAPDDRKGDDDTLSRVDADPSEPEEAGRPNDGTEDAAVDLAAWTRATADDAGDARRTMCRILVPAVERAESSGGPDAAAELVEAARAAVARSHAPTGGVAVDGARDLVFVLPEGVAWDAVATTVAGEVSRRLADPELELEAVSVGLAEIVDEVTVEDALRHSARGLAEAVEAGGGARAFTADEERRRSRDEAVLESIAASLESGDGFRLVYQPKVAVEGGTLVGAEALLRHDGGELGALGPAEFVPLAKEFGMLERLDHWVVAKGVAAVAAWHAQGIGSVPISMNVGPTIFFDPGFAAELAGLLDEHGVDPGGVQIEVAAGEVLARVDDAIERIHALHAVGVTVALDDFGKEDTTPAEMRRLPVDAIKVHRSLVLEMEESESASALVRGVLSLARILGIETVAAGVEREEQLEELRAHGCDAVQGFLFSAPLEGDAFAERLRAHGGSRAVA